MTIFYIHTFVSPLHHGGYTDQIVHLVLQGTVYHTHIIEILVVYDSILVLQEASSICCSAKDCQDSHNDASDRG